jgi:formamidopyrimidine-DNA glycosylase
VPELPEVETVRRQLEPVLTGRTFEHVDIHDARLVRPYEPAEVAAELSGEHVVAVERRGKYLIVRFETGRALLIHLRMTGGLSNGRRGSLQDDPHRRAVVRLENGSDVAYRDVRRFGTWLLLEPGELEPYLHTRVGPEPLETRFTMAFLESRLAGRAAPLKAAILDQRTVAGLGNIYADEALWRARLDPRQPAGDLSSEDVAELRRGIRAALRRGISKQGADLGDGVYASGSMQDEFNVYGRGGEPCRRCGMIIAKTRIAGRGTAFCPGCQAASSASSRPSRSRSRSSS